MKEIRWVLQTDLHDELLKDIIYCALLFGRFIMVTNLTYQTLNIIFSAHFHSSIIRTSTNDYLCVTRGFLLLCSMFGPSSLPIFFLSKILNFLFFSPRISTLLLFSTKCTQIILTHNYLFYIFIRFCIDFISLLISLIVLECWIFSLYLFIDWLFNSFWNFELSEEGRHQKVFTPRS